MYPTLECNSLGWGLGETGREQCLGVSSAVESKLRTYVGFSPSCPATLRAPVGVPLP